MRHTSTGKTKRSFAIESIKDKKGCALNLSNADERIYVSNDPASAAKKVISQLCRAKNIKKEYEAFVTVKETTQNSKKNSYSYNVKREKAKVEGPFGNEFVNVAKSMKGRTMPRCGSKSKKRTKKVSK